MKKDAIEKKDSDLLSRVHELRERNIRSTQMDKEEAEARKPGRFWPIIFVTTGLSVAAFLIFLSVKTDKKPSLTMVRPQAGIVKKPVVEIKPSPEAVYRESTENIQETPLPDNLNERREEPDLPEITEKEQKPISGGQADESQTDPKMTLLEQPEETVRSVEEETYVSALAVAREVLELEPKGRQSTFTVGTDKSVVVWTQIISKKIPTKIEHVYYLNGRKYAEVPLKVNYSRTRTWSRITLRGKEQTGAWRVAVLGKNGKLLEEVEFDVVQ